MTNPIIYPEAPPEDILDLVMKLRYLPLSQRRWIGNFLHFDAWHGHPDLECNCMVQGFRWGNGATEKLSPNNPRSIDSKQERAASEALKREYRRGKGNE